MSTTSKYAGPAGIGVAAVALIIYFVFDLQAADIGYLDVNTIERRISSNRAWAAQLENRLEWLRKSGFPETRGETPYTRIQENIADLDREYSQLHKRLERRLQTKAVPPVTAARSLGASALPVLPVRKLDPQILRGDDWLLLAVEEKEAVVFDLLAGIKREEGEVIRPVAFYVAKIDEMLAGDLYFRDKPVSQLVRFAVYDQQPLGRHMEGIGP